MNQGIAVLVLLFFVLSGCAFLGSGDGPDEPTPGAGGEFVTLEEGQSVFLASLDLQVRFVEKTADSRCPIGVECVWAGEASIVVEITPGGDDVVTLTLTGYVGPDGGGKVAVQAAGYRVTLDRLDPYPVDGGDTGDAQVTARLQVEQL